MSQRTRLADIFLSRRTTSVLVSCFTHPLAFLILRDEYWPIPEMPFFIASFGAAIVLSFSLSMANAFSSNRIVTRVTLVSRIAIFLLLTRALGPSFQVERVLVAGIMLDSLFHEGLVIGSLAGVACIGLTIGVHVVELPVSAMNLAGHWRECVVFAVCGSLWLCVGVVIERCLASVAALSERVIRSEESVNGLMNLNVTYQEHVYQVSERSREEERKRITTDLHDCLGYTMTNIMMMTEAAKYVVRDHPDRTAEHLARIYKQAKEGLAATRATLHDLYQFGPEPITGLTAINRVLKDFEMVAGIKIRVDYADMPAVLGRDTSVAIIRFVQEGITNAFQHGKATRIEVHFQSDRSGVSVTITDNGVGSATVTPGLGIAGMMQRFEDLGGNVAIENRSWGFEVHGWIPYQNDKAAGESHE